MDVTPGMHEVKITIIVRKAIRRIKKRLNLTNLQVRGEHELEDMATRDPSILGRIDITFQFLHQFGNEDAYVAIECKRVGATYTSLHANYVSKGVDRFVTGKYAAGHDWGFMLGYVITLPVDDVVKFIENRMCNTYGDEANLSPDNTHFLALAVLNGRLIQKDNHIIRLKHIFVDMTPAA